MDLSAISQLRFSVFSEKGNRGEKRKEITINRDLLWDQNIIAMQDKIVKIFTSNTDFIGALKMFYDHVCYWLFASPVKKQVEHVW